MEWNKLLAIKWFKIYKNIWFGLFALGFLFFFIQEIPYIIMPFIKLANNPIMEMFRAYPILNILEKITGISTVIAMIFIINQDTNPFPFDSVKDKLSFLLIIILLLGYYLGWIFYFNGRQDLLLVIAMLVALPPLYYSSIGLWRKNYILVILGIIFLFLHIANVWTSY